MSQLPAWAQTIHHDFRQPLREYGGEKRWAKRTWRVEA